MKVISRLTAVLALALAGSTSISAQTFFSVSAGTDGFNASLTNALPFFTPAVMVAPPPPPPHHHHHHHHHERVCVPLLPGLDYPVVEARHYRKAVKRYRNSHASGAIAFPGGGGVMVSIPVGGGYEYYDHWDDDDYEDYLKDRYKHHKKMYKKYKKARKHYKKHHHHHHHHHDDD